MGCLGEGRVSGWWEACGCLAVGLFRRGLGRARKRETEGGVREGEREARWCRVPAPVPCPCPLCLARPTARPTGEGGTVTCRGGGGVGGGHVPSSCMRALTHTPCRSSLVSTSPHFQCLRSARVPEFTVHLQCVGVLFTVFSIRSSCLAVFTPRVQCHAT